MLSCVFTYIKIVDVENVLMLNIWKYLSLLNKLCFIRNDVNQINIASIISNLILNILFVDVVYIYE